MITITDKEFNSLADYIKVNYGICLKKEKQAMVTGRLNNVLESGGFGNFTDYYDYILSDKSGNAVNTLLNKITTNHTYFMREADHFIFFKNTVLSELTDSVSDRDLRIWCAACSTGEESYTIAMLLDEYFGSKKLFWDTKVLATDISEKVLSIAKTGKYKSESLAPLSAYWKINYFKKYDSEYHEISDKIKNEVIYRKFNLMDPVFPFKKKLHVIFCRNVMIYFDNDTRNKLVNKFYDSLEYGGYFFIGHSESINRDESKFRYVMPSVYKKEG